MNILASSIYTVSNPVITDTGQSLNAETSFPYREMYRLSLASYMKNLAKIDASIVFTGNVDSVFDMFRDVFFKTYELWRGGHNILFADVDTLCVKPVEIFDKKKTFYMPTLAPVERNPFWRDMYDMFYCGLRYFPSDMEEDLWKFGDALWNEDVPTDPHRLWDREQFIYNKMFYRQGLRPMDVYDPTIQFVYGDEQYKQPSPYNKEDCHIFHYPASHGPGNSLVHMMVEAHTYWIL